MMLAPPLWIGLLAAAGVGLIAGSWVNWATYTLAWNRLPIWGWLGLRRESHLHGAGFWRRPFAVELFMGLAWGALYWWEVDRQGLIHHQFEALAGRALPVGAWAAPAWITLATFLSHAV